MPLPWLIGAAVVAAAAAVVKVVDDHNEEERRKEEEQEQERREKQEQEARLQHQHKNLTTQLANLKKDRLEAVYESLIRSAEVLEQSKKVHIRPKSDSPLLNSKVEATLSSTTRATSNYAHSMSAILSSSLPNQELQRFLVNLRALETLYGALSIDSALQKDLTTVQEIRNTLHRLQNLKQQIEQQG